MKFRALRTLRGDYGEVHPGQTFEVPEHLVKKMTVLEGKGIVERVLQRVSRAFYADKQLRQYQNKRGA